MAEYYIIKTETLKAFADEARRLSGVTDELSTTEMMDVFSGVKILPNAEEASFGTKAYEYSIVSITGMKRYGYTRTKGYSFIANENICVVGLSAIVYIRTNLTLKLWDVETQSVLASLPIATVDGEWVDGMLGEPVILQAGKKYMLTSFGSYYNYVTSNNVVFSDKITYEAGWSADVDTYPTVQGIYELYGLRLVIGSASDSDSDITEYKIQKDTMTGIADEVKRITGGSDQLTTAQILTALQAVPVATA